jgi:hypothetical protein
MLLVCCKKGPTTVRACIYREREIEKEKESEREREREREREIYANSLGLIPRSGASSNALNRVSSLTILGCRETPPPSSIFFFYKFIGKMLYFSGKKGIIHSHRDLNSVSSSTDKTNLLGPIPSRLRSPAPRVRTRAAASSDGGSTSLSLKPAARNSLELISIATLGT